MGLTIRQATQTAKNRYLILGLFTLLVLGCLAILVIAINLWPISYLQKINVNLELAENSISLFSLIAAIIITSLIAKRREQKTDSWYFLLAAVWCLAWYDVEGVAKNAAKVLGIYEKLLSTSTLYQSVILFAHYFKILGAVFVLIWIYKLYLVVSKQQKPKIRPFKFTYQLTLISWGGYLLLVLLLILTQNMVNFTSGPANEVLDNFERVFVGPAFLLLGMTFLWIIGAMSGKIRGWLLLGMGFLGIGIDRSLTSGGQSLLRYIYGKEAAEATLSYWILEISGHYWAGLVVLLIPIGLFMIYKRLSLNNRGEKT